jgi:macrodomain Ter protein organizer (MatP/YcbG family)
MKVREQLKYLLKAHSDGLTVPQMMERTGKANAHLFRVLHENEGFYIADWLESHGKGPCRAVWKWSDAPQRNKPKPYVNSAKPIRQVVSILMPMDPLAIKTTIRGPWPYKLRGKQ